MGYGGGGGGGGGGSSGGSGGGSGSYTTVGGGSAFGDVSGQELPSYNQAPAGSIRFNTDSKKLEVYILGPVGFGTTPNGIWMEVDSWSPELQTGGTRGLFSGGETPNTNTIDYITIQSTGDAINFGDAQSSGVHLQAGVSDRTRACFGGGRTPTVLDTIDFVTIASTGNAADFGNLSQARMSAGGASNSTRGLFIAGYTTTNVDTIDYITIQSTGNAQDFGNASNVGGKSACQSSTRAVFGGATLEFIMISTLGNASEFGDVFASGGGACSNSVRGLFGGAGPNVNTIEYITIATLGDAVDFGDLTVGGGEMKATSSPTRGVWAGGNRPTPSRTDTIDYVQIMSTGNAIDFGNLTQSRSGAGSASNGHGGL